MHIDSENYSILNWLAVLARYRSYWQKGSISEEAKTYPQEHFFVDPESYDVIVGYRADDSYFALLLGKLGEQIVLKSEISFRRITFRGAEPVPASMATIP